MSMSEYTPRRLKSGKIKADQLKATGAKTCVTSCHNCVDGLTDVIRHYKLGMEVTQLVTLVANAIVIEEKPVVAVPELVAVELGAEHITYRELERRANQLARHLIELGVDCDAGRRGRRDREW